MAAEAPGRHHPQTPGHMRKATILLTLCGCMGAAPLHASFDPIPADPRGLAMSGSVAALPGDAFGMLYNPASPASSAGASVAAACAIPYGDDGLATRSAAAKAGSLPFDRNGAASVAFRGYSPNGYRESSWSAGYSRRLTTAIRAGISVSRMELGVTGFADRPATGINAGIMVEPWPRITLGVSSLNLNSPSIGAGNSLPRTTLAGISYRFDNGNLLTATAQGDPERPGRILAGAAFKVAPSLAMLAGAGTNPSVASAGAAFTMGAVRATAAASRNLDLGTTAAFGLELGL